MVRSDEMTNSPVDASLKVSLYKLSAFLFKKKDCRKVESQIQLQLMFQRSPSMADALFCLMY